MGKKGLSDKVRAKRKEASKQLPNPFEVKVNKVKNVVVNKKLQSYEKGLPGVSRSKAVKKRKDTLLRELHHSKKSNFLLDKRFGEGDSSLTADEKMVQRFALEKKKQLQGKDFSLDDNEETLTHYGQSLAENLQDTINSDSDDDEQAVKAITGDLQFGGLSKDESNMSWKDKMKDIIADSKKLKYERQAQKEKVVETTGELDSIWKAVVPSFKELMQRDPPIRKPSNYMMLFHQLVREQTSAGATDKLKTEEEKAKEEAEKLQVLEAQRLSRMRGDGNEPKSNHVSADDLNDGFALEPQKRKVSFSNLANTNEEEEDPKGHEETQHEDENEVKGDESGSDDGEEEEEDDNGSDDDDDNDEDEEDEEESDNFSDLASDDENEEQEDKEEKDSSGERKAKDKKDHDKGKKEASIKPILKRPTTKQIGNNVSGKSTSELPFVFSAPGSYEEFTALLHGHTPEEQGIILSRLRKCHHPSLAEGNKDKLESIFKYLLQYFGEATSGEDFDSILIKSATTHLWEMSQMFPTAAATYLQKWLLDRQEDYANSLHKKNGMHACVSLNMLLYLCLIGGIFPTSDYRHPVTTPAISFIAQILSEGCVKTMKDCVTGLFLTAQAIQFVALSKRYIPEIVTFLHGLLVMGADEKEATGVKIFPPLKLSSKSHDLLQVHDKCEITAYWSITELLLKDSLDMETDSFRCAAIAKCVDLLQASLNLWEDLPDLAAVMNPIKEPLSILPVQNYPDSLKTAIHKLKTKMREAEANKLHVMQLPTKKPEPLKLFEPKIEEFWSGKKKKGGPNREVNERQRLSHKIKREMKAAVREIKRDNEVLATHQLEVITKKDAERKRKTKELMNSLANQEGDYKAIKRAKH
ncbi:nucleolar protein 14 [Elysia marginata]|uniref:Nucleolar protein 14 n=1 Tax=Elysia marginata TaxID=1093978 RepID=A0AAV4JYJ4_9GAST|nr:nucleolar protein 14 [Elysia marginata]